MAESIGTFTCGDCGYATFYDLADCPICHGKMQHGPLPANEAREQDEHQFTLRSLLLAVTIACVALGAVASVPGLGLPLILIAIAASKYYLKPMGIWHEQAKKNSAVGWAASVSLGIFLTLGACVVGMIAFVFSCSALVIGGAAVLPEKFKGNDTFGWLLGAAAIGGVIIAALAAGQFYRSNAPQNRK